MVLTSILVLASKYSGQIPDVEVILTTAAL